MTFADLALGGPACSAYRQIIEASSLPISWFELCKYESPPPLQARISVGKIEEELIALAQSKRARDGTPFWQALFSVALEMGSCPESLFSGALFHNGPGSIRRLDRSSLSELDGLAVDILAQNISLSSRIGLATGETLHLGFMDFRCAISERNICIVKSACDALYKGSFVIAESGNSYHACGINLLSDQARLELLGKALLLSPIVDVAYVAHQIRQGFSSIRISAGGSSGRTPRVVWISDFVKPQET